MGRPKPTPHLRPCVRTPRSGRRDREKHGSPPAWTPQRGKAAFRGLPAPLPSPNPAKVPLLLRHSGSSLTRSACGNLTHGFGATLVSGPCLHKSAGKHGKWKLATESPEQLGGMRGTAPCKTVLFDSLPLDSYNQKTNKQKQRPPEPPGLPSLHTRCPVTQAARDPWPRPSSFSP